MRRIFVFFEICGGVKHYQLEGQNGYQTISSNRGSPVSRLWDHVRNIPIGGYPSAAYNIQFFGSALLALGVIVWSARSFRDWDAVRSVLIGALVGNVVGLLLALWGIKQGLVNAMGWSSVVVYVLLTAGALYCLRSKVMQTA